MELAISNGLCELSMDEMGFVDGGASVGETIAGTVGVAAVCWAVPVGVAMGAPLLGVGMALVGAGYVVNMVTSNR